MEHEIHKVTSFQKVGPFTLRLRFEDGVSRIIDFRPVLAGELYGPLADEKTFDRVQLDKEAHTLVWPNGADFDPALLYNMHAAWVAFATNGDPGWPKYDLGRRATMRFDATSGVVNDPRAMERELSARVRQLRERSPAGSRMKMHVGEVPIDEALVQRLVAAQFPRLAHLPIRAFRRPGP